MDRSTANLYSVGIVIVITLQKILDIMNEIVHSGSHSCWPQRYPQTITKLNGETKANISPFDGSDTGSGLCFEIPGDEDADIMHATQSSTPGALVATRWKLGTSTLNKCD